MKNNNLLYFLALVTATVFSQNAVVLETDYTIGANEKPNIKHHLNVFNRINPINGFAQPLTPNAGLCVVRPLGGISSNGVADLSKDTYKWNGQEFVTDFTLLKTQIDRIYNSGFGVQQIVLDNPSWAFQRDENGNLPNNNYVVSTYGNAEPPVDFNAWANYLREVMEFLVDNYGEEEMLKVQFGVGREIGTGGHWSGSQEAFFDFYERSINTIRSVLPGAKVGSHFLWGSARNSWGPDFVRWCSSNNIDYDFVGVSYYPAYDRARRTNFEEVYAKDFGVIKDIPEWDNTARLQIHEFALTQTFGGNTFEIAPREHQNSFLVGMMKMFYENDMENLNLWGQGNQYFPVSQELLDLKGHSYHTSTKNGVQNSENNYVDAIFTSNKSQNKYNIMAYNYNANPSSNVSEDLNFNATIGFPSGTGYRYRLAIYDKENESLPWSNWTNATTTNGNSINKSIVSLNTILPVFSFLRYEIEVLEVPLNEVPTVAFTIPSGNITLEEGYSSLVVTAAASDTDGTIGSVDLFIDDTLVRNEVSAPYQWGSGDTGSETLGLAPGTHTFRVVATDNDGATAEDAFVLTVTGASNEPPSVRFAQPSGDIALQEGYSTLVVSAEATDTDGNITVVELYIDDNLERTITSAPYEWGSEDNTDETLGLGPGTYNFRAVAMDDAGATSQDTFVLTVTSGTNAVPTVQFTEPSEKLTLEEGYTSLVVTAEASDTDGSISGIELYIDDKLVREEVVVPYQWGSGNNIGETLGLGPGTYNFRVVVMDDDGATSQDTFVLTVTGGANAVPTVQFIEPSENLTLEQGYTSLVVTAEASDTDGSISGVALYIDDMLIRNDSVAPYEWGADELIEDTLGLGVGTYVFKLIAMDNDGATTEDTLAVSIKPASTIEEKLKAVQIYPNPAGEAFFINELPTEEGIMTIRDMSGKTVLNFTLSTGAESFDVSILTSATYMITIRYDNKEITRKLIKK